MDPPPQLHVPPAAAGVHPARSVSVSAGTGPDAVDAVDRHGSGTSGSGMSGSTSASASGSTGLSQNMAFASVDDDHDHHEEDVSMAPAPNGAVGEENGGPENSPGAVAPMAEVAAVAVPGAERGSSASGARSSTAAAAAAAAAARGVSVSSSAAGEAGNYLVSEAEDDFVDVVEPSSANHPADNSASLSGTNNSGVDAPTAAAAAAAVASTSNMNVVEDADDQPTDTNHNHNHNHNRDHGAASEEDESDYEYEYEDDDEGHYAGFLVDDAAAATARASRDSAGSGAGATAAAAAVIPHAVSATASADGDHAADDAAVMVGAEGAAAEGAAADAAAAAATSSTSAPAAAVATASSSSSSGQPSLLAPLSLAPVRKSKWKEPTRAAVSMSLRAEKETSGGRRRLASDLYKIMMNDTDEAGYAIEPQSEDSMDKWAIRLFGFDTDSNLYKDMLVLGLEHIELEMSFPEQYPFEPPFVRVVRPRFKRQTGFVMNGALCMELLTSEGWNPVNDIESVIVSIRSLLVVGDGRLEAAVRMGETERKRLLDLAKNELERKKSGDVGEDMEVDEKGGTAGRKRPRDDDGGDGGGKKAGGGEGGNADKETSGSAAKKAKAVSKAAAGSYSTTEAKQAYQHLSDFHKKKGWDQSGWWARRG